MPTFRDRLRAGVERGARRAASAIVRLAQFEDERQQTPAKPEPGRKGTTGTQVSGGRIWGYEHNKALTIDKWPAVGEKMLRTDAVMMAAARALIDTQLTARWDFEIPDDASPRAVEARDFLREAFGLAGGRGYISGGWERFLSQALRYQLIGFRYMEEVPYFDAGKYWIDFADCEPSAHYRWHIDENGDLLEVEQQVVEHQARFGEPNPRIPANRLVLFTHGLTGSNFEGLGLLRPCYFPWKLKTHLGDMMAIGAERWAVPTPIIEIDEDELRARHYDEAAIEKMVERAKASVKKLLSHAAGYLSTVKGISFSTYGEGAFNGAMPRELAEWCDRQILTAFGLQFLLLGINDTGSRAVGQVQETFFRRMAIDGLDHVAAVVGGEAGPGRGTVGRLMQWNFPDLDEGEYPRLRHEGLDTAPVLEFLDQLPALINSGAFTPDNATEAAVRNVLRLPPLAEDAQRDHLERMATGNPVGAATALMSQRRRQTQQT